MSAQVAADLRAAADVLECDGWRQESYGSPTGCKCLYGAIHYVASCGQAVSEVNMDHDELDQAARLESAVQLTIGAHGWLETLAWNDAPGRTADEVIAVLRAAADRAEGES